MASPQRQSPAARWRSRRRSAYTPTTRSPSRSCRREHVYPLRHAADGPPSRRRGGGGDPGPDPGEPERAMTSFSPREIVSELDRYIVGQDEAKRAVAIALRNRWRRQQLSPELREEVLPKNILMIGPTGCGKTEIARRLARLAEAPFLKVEATKFTEVGYVGRDVEQIARDLVEIAIAMVRERLRRQVEPKAELAAEDRVLDALVGNNASADTRQKFRKMLREGALDEREIEIQVQESAAANLPTFEVPGMPGASMGMLNPGDIFG